MSTKHTSGEWVVSESNPHRVVVLSDSGKEEDDSWVASTNGDMFVNDNEEESIANAKLISASPNMLEALTVTLNNIRSLGPAGALGPSFETYRPWLEMVSNAINKAALTSATNTKGKV